MVLRWFLDATRVAQLALDNQVSGSTAYRYLHEAIDGLAAAAPGLRGALLAARTAGYSHVHLDGTLIRTDRSRAIAPTARLDLWWSGKHHHHGGNVQVITAPDGWPLWSSDVRPGREHDTTCARADPELLPALEPGSIAITPRSAKWATKREPAADLPDQGRGRDEADRHPADGHALHSATRVLAERGNSLLKTTFKAPRRISFCRWRIGATTAAALVLFHHQHGRTT
jgi:hypothetical protein